MVLPEFIAHCIELLAPAGRVRARCMFGGHGVYLDDLFIAIVATERLYLKADTETQPRFEAAGCVPFSYTARGKPMVMRYFSAPDDAMESPMWMQPWARLALDAALRARAAKRPAAVASAAAKSRAAKP